MTNSNGAAEPTMRGGFPLVALFLLSMVVAIVIVQVKLVFDCDVTAEEVLQTMVPCGVGGMLLGGIVGLHDLRRGKGLVCGLFVGLVTGVVVSPIVLVGVEQPLNAIGTASFCAVGLLVMSTIYRRISLNPRLQKFR